MANDDMTVLECQKKACPTKCIIAHCASGDRLPRTCVFDSEDVEWKLSIRVRKGEEQNG